jgi:hypothetical protein
MDEDPLVHLADGPAGQRARITGTGKDVWEVITAVRENDGNAAEAARYLESPLGLVQAAIAYYDAQRDEIDQWIEINEREAAESRAAWMAGHAASGRSHSSECDDEWRYGDSLPTWRAVAVCSDEIVRRRAA